MLPITGLFKNFCKGVQGKKILSLLSICVKFASSFNANDFVAFGGYKKFFPSRKIL